MDEFNEKEDEIKRLQKELFRYFYNCKNIGKSEIAYSIAINGLDFDKNKKYLNRLDYQEHKHKKLNSYVDGDLIDVQYYKGEE